MGAKEALQLMQDDHGDVNPYSGFRMEFAEDDPYRSLLQRQGKTLEEVLKLFDWYDDNLEWTQEYTGKKRQMKQIKAKRKVDFCVCGWREFNEDFGRGDVSCLRDIRTPLVTSRTPMKAMKDEFNE